MPRSVVAAMTDYLFNHNANTHWAYPSSAETDEIIADSRQSLADFLNASADEIVFGQNMTSLTLHLARALGRNFFSAGDEIIVTELDHHANVDTWRALEVERGVRIRVAPLNVECGTLELSALENLLNEKTRLVAVGAASNILGSITDVKSVCRLAREAGALSFVDAVHYAAHNPVDVKSFDCDFLACSAYKFYGPHIGILYGRKELLEQTDFPKLRPAPDYAPERVETGTQSHESIAGAAAAVDFLASLSGSGNTRREKLENAFRELHLRQKELTRLLWHELSEIRNVKVYGPHCEEPRTSTISFVIRGVSSRQVAQKLSADYGIFASSGDFYALTVVEKLGLSGDVSGGLVRAGCACYTTVEEVERLIDGVRRIAEIG